MITDRQLTLTFTGGILARYKRTDTPISPNTNSGDVNYNDLKFEFAFGSGNSRVDLLHADRYTLNNNVLIFALDGGIQNVWGDYLDFDSVKCILIRNRETADDRYLDVRFKNEHYVIGPGGFRIIVEPKSKGLQATGSSSSEEEGSLVVSTDSNVEFDLIICGSTQEQSSSSSGA